MSSSLLFKAGALALACASTATATFQYVLVDSYNGSTFFDNMDFFTGGDPSNGFVQYVDQVTAAGNTLGGPLISTTDTTAYMGVDYWNPAPNGRPSVRVSTQTAYNYGVFILDLEHMPDNVCGTWPAFWTSSDAPYFEEGEIDIIESINENSFGYETLHTGLDYNGCQVAGNLFGTQQLGVESTYNCFENATTDIYGGTQWATQGCSAYNYVENTYGSDFNENGGGIYALWWTEELIAIYSWPRGSTDIPGDIASGSPYPQTWGEPVFTTAGGNCDVQTYFKNQKLIFDTDFCGAWADQFWSATSCYDKTAYPTCESYVAANPTAYEGAYWTVNSLQVYQWLDVESSSPTSSSSVASSTSSTSTSSSASSTSAAASTTSTTSTSTTSSSTYTGPPQPTPTTVLEVDGCSFVSCYTEGDGVRAFTGASFFNYTVTGGLTVAQCANDCAGFLYFGVEYGGECYCGNSRAPSSNATTSGCIQACDGDATEICGGSDRLNVYYCPPGGSSSSSSSATSTSTSSSSSTTSTLSTSSSVAVSSSSSTSSSSSSSSADPTNSSSSSVASSSTSSSSSSSSTPSSSSSSSSSWAAASSSSTFSSASSSSSSSSSVATSSSSFSTSSTSSAAPISSTSSSSSWAASSSSSSWSSSPSSTAASSSSSLSSSSSSSSSSSPTSTASGSVIFTSSTTLSIASGSSVTSSILSGSGVASSISSSTSWTTSTVVTTTTGTITSCPPTVTNCPLGSVTTDVITLYTTICPVTATETSTSSAQAYTTSTVYTTTVYTITSCAATVTNCPAKLGSVTTEIISLYTTICPVTETETSAPATSSTSIASAYTSPIPTSVTVVKTTTTLYSTSTVKAAFSTVSKFSNSTSVIGTGTAGGVQSSTLTLLVSPTPSHIYSASGASKLTTGSFMALVIFGGVTFLFQA